MSRATRKDRMMMNLELTLNRLESELEHHRGQIIGKAKWMIDDLRETIDRLKEPNGTINGLGVIQGSGSALDIACASYERTKQHIEMVRAAIDADQSRD